MRLGSVVVSACVAVSVLMAGGTAMAQDMNLGEFLNSERKTPEMAGYAKVTGNAYSMMNEFLRLKNMDRLYCLSNDVELSGEQYVAILEATVKKEPKYLSWEARNWQMVLLKGLMDTFPCK